MQASDMVPPVRGQIKLYDVDESGVEHLRLSRSNVIGYSAADILANLVAGDTNAFPQHIGFIYGDNATPGTSMDDPDTLPVATRRVQDWEQITSDVDDASANMIICPLVLNPYVSLDANSDEGLYSANKATFTSHTGAFTEYAFTPGSGNYADELDALGSIYFYNAVLLNCRQSGSVITYTPFARVHLGSPFTAKASNRELAVYWDIIFK